MSAPTRSARTAERLIRRRSVRSGASRSLPVAIEPPELETRAAILRRRFSRVPVFRKSQDQLVGVLHTKDVLTWLRSGRRAARPRDSASGRVRANVLDTVDGGYRAGVHGLNEALVIDGFVDDLTVAGDKNLSLLRFALHSSRSNRSAARGPEGVSGQPGSAQPCPGPVSAYPNRPE